MKFKTLLAIFAILILTFNLSADIADNILRSSSRNNGICAIVNDTDPDLAVSIGKKSKFTVQILNENSDIVTDLRKAIDSQDLYGRINVKETIFRNHLPYTENLINILIIKDYNNIIKKGITIEEILRVVAPYGTLWIKCSTSGEAKSVKTKISKYITSEKIKISSDNWIYANKPYPKEMDEWTHFKHNAEGNMVANDTIVGPPRHVQWVSGPMWQRHHALTPGTTTLLTSEGKIFYIQDESPIGFAGSMGKWKVICRDAFNGKLLWKRDIKDWGDEVWSWWTGGHFARANSPLHTKKRMVAEDGKVFVTLGYNSPVSALDMNTGKTIIEYKKTEYTDEIVYRDGVLYLAVNDRPQKPLPGKGFSKKPSSQNTSKKTIHAIEAKTGKLLWKSAEYTGITDKNDRIASQKASVLGACEDGIFHADKGYLILLDTKTGKIKYKFPIKFKASSQVVYHRGNLIVGDKTITVFDTRTGKKKWTGGTGGNLAVMSINELYAIDNYIWTPEKKSMLMTAYDINTGGVKKEVSIEGALVNAGHHHRCYPNKSTINYFISGRRAAEFTEYESGDIFLHNWTRGACRYGLLPANGLLYKLPDPCSCYIKAKLLGFYALSSEKSASSFFANAKQENPLQKGNAFGAIQNEVIKSDSQWPMFRHDILRSGSVKTKVEGTVNKKWEINTGSKITPPVSAGGRVYISDINKHKVLAFDNKTGKKLWDYIADGKVDTPPAIYGGMVLFGSADGWVYCLRASDGELSWRFRAAPYDRSIMSYDQLESTWPVHGSVAVANGIVYFTSGRSSYTDKGIFIYALDAKTGKLLGKSNIFEEQKGDNKSAKSMPKEIPGARTDILSSDGKDLYLNYRKIDFGVPLKKGENDYIFNTTQHLYADSTFFDDFYFHRVSYKRGKTSSANLIAFNENASYMIRVFKEKIRGHNLYVPDGGIVSNIPDSNKISEEETGLKHIVAVKKGGLNLLMIENNNKKNIDNFPIGGVSMVITTDKLLIAGFKSAMNPSDPWANFEGKKDSLLYIMSIPGGKKISEYKLETLPVWNGMAAADGHIYISLKNGKLICLGE